MLTNEVCGISALNIYISYDNKKSTIFSASDYDIPFNHFGHSLYNCNTIHKLTNGLIDYRRKLENMYPNQMMYDRQYNYCNVKGSVRYNNNVRQSLDRV